MKNMGHVLLLLLVIVAVAVDCQAGEVQGEVTLASVPPSVAKTVPACGDTLVDPTLGEVSVTFSKDMKVTGHCWSWCYAQEDAFPSLSGVTRYLDDNRTCALGVVLEPEKTYAIWINTDVYQSFQDTQGHPAVPYLLVFRTASKQEAPGADGRQ